VDSFIFLYHGTKFKYTANRILKEGFQARSYFAKDLGDAIEFGGKYVFMVVFIESDIPDNWQVICANPISADRIMNLSLFKENKIYKNESLRKKVFANSLEFSDNLAYQFIENNK